MTLTVVKTTALTGTITNAQLAGGIDLTSKVTGTLPIANGGTNSTATTFVNATTNVTGALPIVNGGTGATSFSPGKLLQTVNGTLSSYVDTSSTSYADTGLSVAITPSATSSKILVLVNHTGLMKESSNNAGKIELYRVISGGSSSSLGMFENDFGRTASTALNIVGGSSTSHLDSPNTTSAITYKTRFACSVTASATIRLQQNDCIGTITAMEISA